MPRNTKIKYPRACVAPGCKYAAQTSSAYTQHISKHHPELRPGKGRQGPTRYPVALKESPRDRALARPRPPSKLDSFLAMVAWAFPKGIPTNDKEALAEALAWIHETRMLMFGKEQG